MLEKKLGVSISLRDISDMAPETFQDTNVYDDEQTDEERERYVALR